MKAFKILILTLTTGFARGADNPNAATYEFVTRQILEDVAFYLTKIPKNIPHDFNVSFLFPKLDWIPAYADNNSDEFYCFTDKIKRRLKHIYYANNPEYLGATPIRMRNFYNNTYVIAEFAMHFTKSVPWPAWNITRVTSIFPPRFEGLVTIFQFPKIDASHNPFVNYTANKLEWFDEIANVHDMNNEKDTISYYGYYNIPPPPETYFGPATLSVVNLFFYGLIGFNAFAIVLVFIFWCVNGTRDSLLLSYWLKGRDDVKRTIKDAAPGDMKR